MIRIKNNLYGRKAQATVRAKDVICDTSKMPGLKLAPENGVI
jgi:hypothetical protein